MINPISGNPISYYFDSVRRFNAKCRAFNYTPVTTFWSDFTIADGFGMKAILDTYNQAKKEWMDNVEYMAELTTVLNWKIWDLYEDPETEGLAQLYNTLWEDCQYKCCYEHFEGDDLSRYLDIID